MANSVIERQTSEADVHHNFVGGSWRDPEGGGTFEARAPSRPGELFGRWPRSQAVDACDALARAAAGRAAWSSLTVEDRARWLERGLHELRCDTEGTEALAERLGLEARDLRWPREPQSGARSCGGPVLLRLHWTELTLKSGRVLLQHLLAGDPVLWISDPALPEIGELWARAFERAKLPHDVFTLLHDDTRDALRGALSCGAAQLFEASGPPSLCAELEQLACTAPARTDDPHAAFFGAGVVEAAGPELCMRELTNTSYCVTRDADPEAAARRVLERSLHRSQLGGQRPGSVGRVLCHQRLFSAFSAALLAELEGGEPSSFPVLESELERHLSHLVAAGLDEGATLVHRGWSDGAADSHSARRKPKLSATVFTNVEEAMGLARARRPCPLLCLLRVPSDAAGEALRGRLDGPDAGPA